MTKQGEDIAASKGSGLLPCGVISVGVPRSGTSLLSRILNDSPDLLVIDDLYYLQSVDMLGGFDEVDPKKMRRLGDHLKQKLRERVSQRSDREFKRSLLLSEQALVEIDAALERGIAAGDNWSALLRRFMSAVATAEGKPTWGYNTPQDYLHLERLTQAFPETRFIFQMRNPHSVLKSYKNIWRDTNYSRRWVISDPRRYNPVIQSLHWRACARAYLNWRKRAPGRVLLLRYEDLAENTLEAIRRLSEFLEIRLPIPDLRTIGSNPAYINKEITHTELWIARMTLGKTATELGYPLEGSYFRVADLTEVLRVLLSSGLFYGSALLHSADMRRRVARGLRYLLVKNHRAGG